MISLTVNGKPLKVDADPSTPLLWVLRDDLQLTGTKYGCGIAQCGACTVHLDGQADPLLRDRRCRRPAASKVTTIEGLGEPARQGGAGRLGGKRTCRSAATASRARSCRPRPCWRRTPSRATRTSTRRWTATSAAAAPITASARAIQTAAARPEGEVHNDERRSQRPAAPQIPERFRRAAGGGLVIGFTCRLQGGRAHGRRSAAQAGRIRPTPSSASRPTRITIVSTRSEMGQGVTPRCRC